MALSWVLWSVSQLWYYGTVGGNGCGDRPVHCMFSSVPVELVH
jgi:hypothetical protein